MISETELRLGNFVNDEYTTVVGIPGNNYVTIHRAPHHKNGEAVISINTSELTPLLLTGAILENMQFEKDANADFFSRTTSDGNSIAVRPGTLTYVYIYKGDYEHRTRISQMENMSVHYFQNLYFAITGIDCSIQISV